MEDNNLKEELETSFNLYRNWDRDPKNWGSIFHGLDVYFNFIANTKPFNKIVQDLFIERNNSASLNEVYSLYQKIIFDKEQSINLRTEILSSKTHILIFHGRLLGKIKEEQIKNKRLIILHIEEKSNQIYFEDDRLNCYTFKGIEPARFKIILALFKSNKPKTVKDILVLLRKDEEDTEIQNNLRKEIIRINEGFMEKCISEEELILSPDTKNGRSVYLLNRDNFEYKKG